MIWGAVTNYLRGTGKIPRVVAAAIYTGPFIYLLGVSWEAFGAFLLIWLVGYMPGWGRYVRLDDHPIDDEPEVWWIDKIIKHIDGSWNQKFAGACLRGLHFTIPLVLYLNHLGHYVNPIWAGTGALFGVAYLLAYRINKDPTAAWGWGEFIWGGMLGVIYTTLALTV